ncbi:Fe-S cluster assembly scaffold protein NifU [candidate division KSB1 bacterium]
MYSKKVMDHFYNPRNVGEIDDASGVGEVGNPTCGDIMKMWLSIDDKGIITDAKFRTFGCASAIATSSISTEMIIGKHVDEARKITNKAIADALDGLPMQKMHCSVLAADALNKAIDDFHGIVRDRDEEIICKCLNIDRATIEEAVAHGAFSLDAVRETTGATSGACKGTRCTPEIEEILKKYEMA